MLLADLSGASVSNSYGPSPVYAALNGRTILELPSADSLSLDGKLFKLIIAGRVTDDGNPSTDGIFYISINGSATSIGSSTGVTHASFIAEHDCIWDSFTNKLNVIQTADGTTNGNLSMGFSGLFTVTTQPIQFSFGAYWNNTSNPVSVQLTQFTLNRV